MLERVESGAQENDVHAAQQLSEHCYNSQRKSTCPRFSKPGLETMKNLITAACLLAMFCFVSTGCGEPTEVPAKAANSGADDHDDHGHDHDGDGHADHEDHDEHDGHDHGEEGHDEHDHDFESLADAAKEIASLRDVIRDGFAADKVDDAHGPLHHIGEVLEAAEKLVAKIEDEDQKKAASEAIETLFDSFGAVDQGLHDKEGKKYDEVSDAIDAAIEVLQK